MLADERQKQETKWEKTRRERMLLHSASTMKLYLHLHLNNGRKKKKCLMKECSEHGIWCFRNLKMHSGILRARLSLLEFTAENFWNKFPWRLACKSFVRLNFEELCFVVWNLTDYDTLETEAYDSSVNKKSASIYLFIEEKERSAIDSEQYFVYISFPHSHSLCNPSHNPFSIHHYRFL
jgi:hypothetical protein